MPKTDLDLTLQQLLRLEPASPSVPESLVPKLVKSAADFMNALKTEGREHALRNRVEMVEKEMANGSPYDEYRKMFIGLFQVLEEMEQLDLFVLDPNFGVFGKDLYLPYVSFPSNLRLWLELSEKYRSRIPHLKAFNEYRTPLPPPFWREPESASAENSQSNETFVRSESPYRIGHLWNERLYQLGQLAEREHFWGCNLILACRNTGDQGLGHPRLMAELSAYLESRLDEALLAIQMAALELARGKVNRLPPNCSHSDDFRAVTWFGTPYTFTPNQALCVQSLWSAYERGWPGSSKADLLNVSNSGASDVKDIFKNSPAWKTMIVSPRQGIYCLNPATQP